MLFSDIMVFLALPPLGSVLLILPIVGSLATAGFQKDEQQHLRVYYRQPSLALCYSSSIVPEISHFLSLNYSVDSLAKSIGLNKNNLPHPDRLKHSLALISAMQSTLQQKLNSLLRAVYSSFSARQRRGLLNILGIASVSDVNHLVRDSDSTQRQLRMNTDSLARAVAVFKEFVKSGRESSKSTLRITVSTAIDMYHMQSMQLAEDLDREISRVLEAVLTRQAHADQVPPSSVLQKNTIFAVSFEANQTITLLIRAQPFAFFTSILRESVDCCVIYSNDARLGARVPCNVAGNIYVLPTNEPLHRFPPVGGNYCDAHIINETCSTIRLNVTSYEDFPIRTCGNSTSTRGGVETLRAVNSRLHLHCRTNIQLSSVITRLSNELSLVRKDFSESIHSAEFPANTFFTSPNSAPTGMRSFHFYFGFVATVLIAIGIIVIAVMAKMIWVLRTRVTRASEDSDRVKSALVRANLIELVTHGQDGGVAGAI